MSTSIEIICFCGYLFSPYKFQEDRDDFLSISASPAYHIAYHMLIKCLPNWLKPHLLNEGKQRAYVRAHRMFKIIFHISSILRCTYLHNLTSLKLEYFLQLITTFACFSVLVVHKIIMCLIINGVFSSMTCGRCLHMAKSFIVNLKKWMVFIIFNVSDWFFKLITNLNLVVDSLLWTNRFIGIDEN